MKIAHGHSTKRKSIPIRGCIPELKHTGHSAASDFISDYDGDPLIISCISLLIIPSSIAWFDETHVAIAKVTGYFKWLNAVGPDMIKEKMGKREGHNHFLNNLGGTVVTPEMILFHHSWII